MADLNLTDVIRLIGLAKFVPMSDSDKMGFAGCESENPLIDGEIEYNGRTWLVSVDDLGTKINYNIIHCDTTGTEWKEEIYSLDIFEDGRMRFDRIC